MKTLCPLLNSSPPAPLHPRGPEQNGSEPHCLQEPPIRVYLGHLQIPRGRGRRRMRIWLPPPSSTLLCSLSRNSVYFLSFLEHDFLEGPQIKHSGLFQFQRVCVHVPETQRLSFSWHSHSGGQFTMPKHSTIICRSWCSPDTKTQGTWHHRDGYFRKHSGKASFSSSSSAYYL